MHNAPTFVIKHVSNNCRLFVNFKWMTTENNSLDNQTVRIYREERPTSHKIMAIARFFEYHNGGWRKHYRSICAHCAYTRLGKESLILKRIKLTNTYHYKRLP